MNKLFFLPQVAEQTIYFPIFAEQSCFSQKNIANSPPPQESNGRPLNLDFITSHFKNDVSH